jgi:hypothetical protein
MKLAFPLPHMLRLEAGAGAKLRPLVLRLAQPAAIASALRARPQLHRRLSARDGGPAEWGINISVGRISHS